MPFGTPSVAIHTVGAGGGSLAEIDTGNALRVALNDAVGHYIANAKHGRDALLRLLTLMIQAFGRDHDIAFLFLFEGRRMRGGSHEVILSKGFMKFMEVVSSLIDRGREDGSLRTDIPGKDCGQVWINEDHLALEFACDLCLHPPQASGLDEILDDLTAGLPTSDHDHCTLRQRLR